MRQGLHDWRALVVTRVGNFVTDVLEFEKEGEEYRTFGRLDDRWELKEVLPPARGKKGLTEENVDEGSGAGQIERYYRQSRAA